MLSDFSTTPHSQKGNDIWHKMHDFEINFELIILATHFLHDSTLKLQKSLEPKEDFCWKLQGSSILFRYLTGGLLHDPYWERRILLL
jgi:hypothetical protein